ncbi:MAG: hypothetical protein ABSF28_19475 [Terracidiphilus sp.]|jgi:hypothetical protein
MMQAAWSRHGKDLAVTSGIRFSITLARRLLRQSEVSAVVVVVEDVLGHQALHVAFIQHDYMIEQITVAIADKALCHADLLRPLKAGLHRMDA